MGGVIHPPGCLSLVAHWWMPQIGWFFMRLFLAILAISWTGHFCQFFENCKNFRVDIFFQNRSINRSFYTKIKKRHFFLMQIIFFLYLNMNHTYSRLSFEVSNMSVAQNFHFFCQFLTKIICHQVLKFSKKFRKMTWPGPIKCLK